ncbi:MAG: histidinol-phosphatase [Rhodospirillales bacterium]|nr:histidinol-phosphatase [Rhodospirillales bacterium]
MTNTQICPKEFVDLALRLAEVARPIAQKYFRSNVAIDDKDDASPVTIADREIEAAMRKLIEAIFPDHGIFGEEYGKTNENAEFVWVLDPIDGTKSFITGKPLFGTLISLTENRKPILGIIDQAINDELWLGAKGLPTMFNGKPATTRSCKALGDAYMYSTSPDLFDREDGTYADFENLRQKTKHTLYGGDCYAYGLVASGHADIVCETGLNAYDFCALIPVVEGAGGSFTDWDGRPLTVDSAGDALALGDASLLGDALAALGS